MMYGLSKAVDILSVSLDYDHSSEMCRSDLAREGSVRHRALCSNGRVNHQHAQISKGGGEGNLARGL